jgi:hypothetical protein
VSIVIESGIEMPAIRKAPHTYPWVDMKVGDSFFVEGGNGNSLSACASETGKKLGRRFIRRTVEGGFRVWRVS